MDFVIFGVGLGATLVLLGWLWRSVGPRLRFRARRDSVLSGEELVARISWTRFCRSGGALWVLGGCVLVLAVFVSLLLHLSDHTGSTLVVAVFAAFCLGVIVWLWAYLHRFGLIGLVPKHEPKPVPASPPAPNVPVRHAPGRSRQPGELVGPPIAALLADAMLGPAIPAGLLTVDPGDAAASAERAELAAESIDTIPAGRRRRPVTAATDAADEPGMALPAAAQDTGTSDTATAPEPTVVGAQDCAERVSTEESQSATVRRVTPILVNANARKERPVADRSAAAPSDEAPAGVATEGHQATPATAEPASTKRDDAGDADAPATARAIPPKRTTSPPARTTGNARRAFDSEAFRASTARQEAHLHQAANRRTGQHQRSSGQASESPRRFPAPHGQEGVQWVRGDGTTTSPAGFPIKGDPATRLYYAESSPLYDHASARYCFATTKDAEAAGYKLAPPPQRSTGTRNHSQRPASDITTQPHDITADAAETRITGVDESGSSASLIDHDGR